MKHPCPRCGHVREAKPQRFTDDNPHGLCRDCKDADPDWPAVVIPDPMPSWKLFVCPDEQAEGLEGVVKLLLAVCDSISVHRVRAAAVKARATCGRCGCLTLADEPCPQCRIGTLGISLAIAPRSEVGHHPIRSTLESG